MVVCLALKSFLPDLRDQPCPIGGRIHKPLRRPEIVPEIVPTEQTGETLPPVGTAQPPVSESSAHAGQAEPGCGHAVLEWCDSLWC